MAQGREIDSPELKAKKAYAREVGIEFHPSVGMATIDSLIQAKLNGKEMQEEIPISEAPNEVDKTMEVTENTTRDCSNLTIPPPIVGGKKLYMDEKEFRQYMSKEDKINANRLVRCRIVCMNPSKRNWTGEYISAGSSAIGTFKKFIPYNIDEPYHVPEIIYNYLKERKCRIGTTVKLPNGQEVNRYKLINEYAIEVLPPLTQEELKDLAQRQAMASGTTQ